MAGAAILKKSQNSKTANLNITLHSTPPASICCCLWLQQLQVVESNNNKCISKDRPMKHISNNYCLSSSSCPLDDRISANYNYNIQKTLKQKKHQQAKNQRPLTLSSVVVIIMSLSIFLIQMPTMVQSKAIYGESFAEERKGATTKTSAELETKLLLSLLAEAQPRRQLISSSTSAVASEDESSLNQLTSIEVLRHIKRTQEHQRERRIRLRKRHVRDLIITKYMHENSQNLEWKNPCNVDRVNMAAETRHVTKQQIYQYLKKFERDIIMEYELINITANSISLTDMAQWDIYADVYKFLPKLSANGSITLSRWYRNIQVYVASFGYLARSQYKYDMKKRSFAGDTSNELNKLLASARFILCELETTINGSAPNNNLKKLKTISRKAMNNRLSFVTRRHQANIGGVVEPFLTDLKFAKFCYFQFLSNMQKILNHKLLNRGKQFGLADSVDYNNSNTIIVGDDTSSIDFSSIFKSDSSLSVGESFELLFKTTKKPHAQRHRTQKRKNAKLPVA